MEKALIVRIVVSLIALVNAVCAAFNLPQLEVDEATVYTAVSFAAMIAAWAWGFWKNANFTEAAKEGQKVTDSIKNGMDDGKTNVDAVE